MPKKNFFHLTLWRYPGEEGMLKEGDIDHRKVEVEVAFGEQARGALGFINTCWSTGVFFNPMLFISPEPGIVPL